MTRTYFDISDVVEFFAYNLAATGIQRVQLEFIRYFSTHEQCMFVIENSGREGFIVVDNALLLHLVGLVDTGMSSRSDLDPLIRAIRTSPGTAMPNTGDIFFVSGAFWSSSSTSRSWMNAKVRGAKVGFLCYDLIPLNHPEFCDAGLVDAFCYSVDSVLHVTDFVFTISDYVKTEVEKHLKALQLKRPVIALPLAHELAPSKGDGAVGAAVLELTERPYVLFVSTIEARKNHAYTLTLWQRLLATMPADRVPDLVWVGRQGWMVGDLLARVERLDHLNGKLHILKQLSDNELKLLYERSLFTIYPSLAEGWGLPVAESLVFGKPCIASNMMSIPEVGGDFVWYIDPFNVTQGVELVTSLLDNPDRIEAQANRIRDGFKPRLWADVGRNLMAGFKSLEAAELSRDTGFDMSLQPGVIYQAGSKRDKSNQLSPREWATLDLIFDEGWYRVEPWGRWMKGVEGGFRLDRSKADASERVLLFIKAQSVQFWAGSRVRISCPQASQEAFFDVLAGTRFDFYIDMLLPAAALDIIISVDRIDVAGGADARPLSLGLVLFGYALAGTSAAQTLLAAADAGPRAKVVQAQPLGTEVLQVRRVSPGRLWVHHVLKRALNEGVGATARRCIRRVRLYMATPQ
jgi:glycosyltransferase involved in cell wall biosynthesis